MNFLSELGHSRQKKQHLPDLEACRLMVSSWKDEKFSVIGV